MSLAKLCVLQAERRMEEMAGDCLHKLRQAGISKEGVVTHLARLKASSISPARFPTEIIYVAEQFKGKLCLKCSKLQTNRQM